MKNSLGIGGAVAAIAALATVGNQLVAIRGQLIEQRARLQVDSLAVANRFEVLEGRIQKNHGQDRRMERRIQLLERAPTRAAGAQLRAAGSVRPVRSDSVLAARSPGPVEVIGRAATAPARWIWGGLRAVFGSSSRRNDGDAEHPR